MPELLVQAFLVAEDRNFYHHPGLDLIGVFKAAVRNTLKGRWNSRPMGASTITQQVVKNFFTGSERSMERKIKEAIMALRLESGLSKKRILELYLNQIYLGAGCYGVTAAAETYFGKKLEELSVDEVAYLASLPKAPETYQSERNPALTKARRDWILESLYELGFINGQTFLVAKERPISIINKGKPQGFHGEYFVEAARLKLIETVGKKNYDQGGYVIQTTVDPKVQSLAHRSLKKGLELYDKRMGFQGPIDRLRQDQNQDIAEVKKVFLSKQYEFIKPFEAALITEISEKNIKLILGNQSEIVVATQSFNETFHRKDNEPLPLNIGDVVLVRSLNGTYIIDQIPKVTGGIVVMHKHTGRVLAVSGGYDFKLNQHNSATQAHRQPGSSFKPFVYLAALERGYSKDSKILDAPISIPLGFTTKDGMTHYKPKNFTGRFYGLQTLTFGLSRSINLMTVRLAMQIGMKSIARVAHDFGVYASLPKQLAMVLGAGETTLLKLTAAYAMLGNGGKKIVPTLIDSINDRHGNSVYAHETGLFQELEEGRIVDVRETVAKEQSLQQIQEMLFACVKEGTARRLWPICEKYKVKIYGKTGSSNECKDTWFVGIAGDLVVGVFVGYATPKSLGEKETGGVVATPVAVEFFDQYFKAFPPKQDLEVEAKEEQTHPSQQENDQEEA